MPPDSIKVDMVKGDNTQLRDENGVMIGSVETFTDVSELARQREEIDSLRRSCHLEDGFHGIIGESPEMQQLFELIDNVAPSDTPVLIYGQSGTGKELVARAIHEASSRRSKPFIKVGEQSQTYHVRSHHWFNCINYIFIGLCRLIP